MTDALEATVDSTQRHLNSLPCLQPRHRNAVVIAQSAIGHHPLRNLRRDLGQEVGIRKGDIRIRGRTARGKIAQEKSVRERNARGQNVQERIAREMLRDMRTIEAGTGTLLRQ